MVKQIKGFMKEHQEWVLAWLVAGGLFLMIKQIVEWMYHLLKKLSEE